ncbi:MAG: 16S rRNA processing protein RimM [Nitrospirae bacterium]|nr:MAG: 16S rRNA processing protein RimM [Nitrospirota bacterium]
MVVIGKILSSWGIKGEAKVLPLTFSNERFAEIESVYFYEGQDFKRLTIEHFRVSGKYVILKFRELSTPEEVTRLKGKELFIEKEKSPPLPEGVYYHYQILGLKVYTEQGLYLGEITNIIETGSNDVYVVTGEREVLIPAIDEVVKEIDLKKKRMTIHPMKGLLD